MPAAHIIVADDEQSTREFLESTLLQAGHKVLSTQSGQQLVRICRSLKFDLIIADIGPADANILDALAAAPPPAADTPIILISAHDAPNCQERASDSVMCYFKTPLKPDDIIHAVDLALARFGQFRVAKKEAHDAQQEIAVLRKAQEPAGN